MTGGGTGGHVNPAIAIAEIIKINHPDAEIAFVGTKKGLENKLVPNAGYHLYHINIQGIRRSLSPANIKTAFLVLTSPHAAKKIIKEFKPDIVIGTGGYVCWPLLRAASDMGIPSMVHESNASVGVAVKQLKDRVDVVMTNFASTAQALEAKARVVQVGNPINADFGRYTKSEAHKILGIEDKYKTVVLSCGGSRGAENVNNAVLELIENFSSKRDDIIHYHASGSADAERVQREISARGLLGIDNIRISEYIYNMPILMAAADIVICRAGAMTLSEIAAMRKAAVIIPSPNVTDNHQYKNAKVLADKGAAVLLEERELEERPLSREVMYLANNCTVRAEMEKNISDFASDDVGRLIYREISELLKSKK